MKFRANQLGYLPLSDMVLLFNKPGFVYERCSGAASPTPWYSVSTTSETKISLTLRYGMVVNLNKQQF
ncbi:hypothetical protein WJ0W_001660 [Paenibacillus melissococcoides]|uniref:Uncharacterized protein n=1 Tax=Paenibacillus melissococcoides TaxID=2912268 RepID=A0ABM9FYS6_9BACL|nr:hypothetical protein WJ0W_001660 [Paenibacillus melissococcoides]